MNYLCIENIDIYPYSNEKYYYKMFFFIITEKDVIHQNLQPMIVVSFVYSFVFLWF